MREVYADFAENWMELKVIKGIKTESERFAGAIDTYCIEALMQDGKALQSGTSHFLGQNFAKAFDVTFSDKNNQLDHVWASSWGVSTRLVGALVMAHSDDQGLVLPPMIAPLQVVIVPIYKGDEQNTKIYKKVIEMVSQLKGFGVRVKYDDNDNARPGWKFAEYELKGVPIRIAIGERDIENNTVELSRRDTKQKMNISAEGLPSKIPGILDDIQKSIYNKALAYRDGHITEVNSWKEFGAILEEKGGFLSAHWDGTTETEAKIKDLTKATIRCIPLNNKRETGKCVLSGKASQQRVLFAQSY